MKKVLLLLTSMATAVLLAGGMALAVEPAEPVLDQQNAENLSQTWCFGGVCNSGVAQIFTAGASGDLKQVDLPILLYDFPGMAPWDLVVEIKTLNDQGWPSGETLASKTVSYAEIPSALTAFSQTPEWTEVDFEGSVPVSAGTQYAVVLSNNLPTGCTRIDPTCWWHGFYQVLVSANPNPYPSGYVAWPNGADWIKYDGTSTFPDDNYDLGFKTYVSPNEPTDTTPPDPPTIKLDASSDSGTENEDTKDDNITNINKPTFEGTAEPGSTVKVSVDGSSTPLDSLTADSEGKWSLPYPQDETALYDGEHSITATATDAADNTSDPSSELKITIDLEPPEVTDLGPTTQPNDKGWYKADVENAFRAEDALSGLDDPSQEDGFERTTEGEGENLKVSSGPVTDIAGNENPGIYSGEFKVDKTAPTLNPSISPDPVLQNEPAKASAGAVDDLSGIASSECGAVDTSTAGSKSVSCTATDNAGNENSTSLSYDVVPAEKEDPWTHKGFYSPVDMNGTLNIAKAGSTVPLKFEVFDGTTEITDIGKVNLDITQETTCPSSAKQDTIETYSSGVTNLRYDTTSGQFIGNWKTPKTPEACYKVALTSEGNDTPTTAWFKLK